MIIPRESDKQIHDTPSKELILPQNSSKNLTEIDLGVNK
jgi:hypothetical protein